MKTNFTIEDLLAARKRRDSQPDRGDQESYIRETHKEFRSINHDAILSRIDAYCYMIQRGVKPAGMIPVQKRHLDTILEYINEHYSLATLVEPLPDDWVTLWIYKHPHIKAVIEALPEKPQSAFDHWVLGKLFGYDEHAIGEFIAKNC